MTPKLRTILATLPIVAVAAVPAIAANPESGTVSNTSPEVKWVGETINGGLTTLPAIINGSTVVCQAPSCDTFTLTVADKNDLTVTGIDDNESAGFLLVEVVKPNDEVVYAAGEETSNKTAIKIRNAEPGEYTVHIANNSAYPASYSATAALATQTTAVPTQPNGGDTKPGDPQVNPPTEPEGNPPAATLSLKTTSASLRKSRKRLKIRVATTSPVTDLKAQLKKGKKVVGRGKLARLDGRRTVKLKLAKRLKPGRYVMALTARDGERPVGLSANFRLKR